MENKLTAEQMEKLKACKTAEEVKEFAEKENIELTDEEMEGIVGGVHFYEQTCLVCGVTYRMTEYLSARPYCPECGCSYTTGKRRDEDIDIYDPLFK